MKFRQFIPFVVSILMAVLFLFTSTGFNIYIHHCSLESHPEYTVLSDNLVCDHPDACRDHDQADQTESSSPENNQLQKGKCCTTVSQFMKIHDSYQQRPQVNLTGYFLFVDLNLFNTARQSMPENLSPADYYYTSPPLLTGVEQLIFISQLKIPALS